MMYDSDVMNVEQLRSQSCRIQNKLLLIICFVASNVLIRSCGFSRSVFCLIFYLVSTFYLSCFYVAPFSFVKEVGLESSNIVPLHRLVPGWVVQLTRINVANITLRQGLSKNMRYESNQQCSAFLRCCSIAAGFFWLSS